VNECWTTRGYSRKEQLKKLTAFQDRYKGGLRASALVRGLYLGCHLGYHLGYHLVLGEQGFYSTVNTYILFFLGVPPSSAVGISCSPGRTHSIGPSSLWLRCVRWREERAPHGRVRRRNGQSSRRSGGRVERRGEEKSGRKERRWEEERGGGGMKW